MKHLALLLSASLLISASVRADNHEAVLTLDELTDAFGWDMANMEVTSEKVADGLYVLFGAGGNIAVSIGADGVLIVDDQFPAMMDKIEAEIGRLGGDGVDYAINTHWHFDHAEGNNTLGPKGTTIVAHAKARDDMARGGMVNLVIAKYNQQPYPMEALPSITYTDSMSLHYNGGPVSLLHFAPAHTTGDSAIYFEGVNAVHLGDVFNNSGYPFIDVDSGGSIDGMIKFCKQTLAAIKPDTIVIPGHGPVTDTAALQRYIYMLETMRERVANMIEDGMSLEEVMAANPTGKFDEVYGPESASLGFVNRVYTSLTK